MMRKFLLNMNCQVMLKQRRCDFYEKTVAILFGGCSSEYDVSLISATSVIKNIKKDKYNLLMIGITRDGDFYLYNGDVNNIEKMNG